ncbi:MAG TPA: hypothetical protein DCE71_08625 [Parachlamydiales bacterium]|nr:hypothetical protein [Parachlamydiales bacterium]
MKPSHYGCFGLLIAEASILAAKISYHKSSCFFPQHIIQQGAAYIFAGGVLFTITVSTGIFTIQTLALPAVIFALFIIFFGIGLVIPNSLSHALKPYQTTAGTAGSLFGGCYYCLIAGFTWAMSAFHNGTAFPLPLYIALLGLILIYSAQMIRPRKAIEE